jgi:predicted lipoprotein with Yx(FWY)xxD motif
MKNASLVASLLVTVLFSTAHAAPVYSNGYMTDPDGRTLYTFDKDESGKSHCSSACLETWPAFLAKPPAAAQGEFSLINGTGGRQWAWKNKPLYYYVGDVKTGDRNGDGSSGVWHAIPRSAGNDHAGASYNNGYAY